MATVRIGMGGSLAALLALTVAACSDDGADSGAGAGASAAGSSQAGGGGTGASAGRGTSGSGAGSGGGSGRNGSDAGASGGMNGGSGQDGEGGTGASSGSGGASAGDGGSGEGDAGQGADDSCESDGDCVLCTLPLAGEMPCCDGCPAVNSKAQCDAERAAASKDCQPGLLPVCPAILCVAPGSPKCESGRCISIPGLEQ